MTAEGPDYERLAAELEASGRYRVLRRLDPHPSAGPPPARLPEGARLALVLDLETTGLDARVDEVIELALLPFAYSDAGEVIAAYDPFEAFNQPTVPIPKTVTALTGITDEMVRGRSIDIPALEALVARASLVVAHNAGFDRRFAERVSASFSQKPWACSMREIDWAGEGFEGLKLAYLAAGCGVFYDRHRALSDCQAALALLNRPLPISGGLALSALLATARRPVIRIYAENTPFEMKDRLKARGYRWSGEALGRPKAWFIDVLEEARAGEIAFLEKEIYGRDPDLLVTRLTAKDRHSDRG